MLCQSQALPSAAVGCPGLGPSASAKNGIFCLSSYKLNLEDLAS